MRFHRALALSGLLALSLSACAPAPAPGTDPTAGPISTLQITLNTRARVALPPDAEVELSLTDVTPTLAAVPNLAERTIKLRGRQIPVHLVLRYDTSRVDLDHEYALRAVVRSGQRTLFETRDAPRVITRANPIIVDVWVAPPRGVPRMQDSGRP